MPTPLIGQVAAIVTATAKTPIRTLAGYGIDYVAPFELPTIGEYFDLYSRQYIQYADLRRLLRMQGVDLQDNQPERPYALANNNGQLEFSGGVMLRTPDPWTARLWASFKTIDPPQILQWLNRGWIASSVAYYLLREHGYIDPQIRGAIMDSRMVIPAPGQVLDMSLRGALDPNNYGPGGLDEEYDDTYNRWANANGLGGTGLGPNPDGSPGPSMDFARALWAMHWVMPTLAEYFEMRRRLRGSVANPGVSADPSGLILPPDIETAVYRQNNIHPYWRQALSAISYRPISLRYLDVLYKQGQYDYSQYVDAIIADGYHPDIASKLANARIQNLDIQKNKELIKDASARIESAWELGTISDSDYVQYLQDIGLQPDEAQSALQLAQAEHMRKRAERLIRTLRQQALTGQISMQQASDSLFQWQIDSTRIQEYINDWTIELSGRRRIISAGQAVSAVGKGLMSIDDLIVRLTNLRYNNADISVFVGEAQFALAQRLASAVSKAASAAEKQKRKAEQAAKQIEQAFRQSQSALAKHGSPKQLAQWVCQGLLSPGEATARLEYLGWPQPDIDRLLAECEVKQFNASKTALLKHASPAKLKTWYCDGLISDLEVRERLTVLQWPNADIVRLLAECDTSAAKLVKLGGFPPPASPDAP